MRILLTASLALLPAARPTPAQSSPDPWVLRPVHYDLAISVDFAGERIDGTARIRLRNEHARPVKEASLLLYRLLRVRGVRGADGAPLAFRQSVVAFEGRDKLQVNHLRVPLVPALAPGRETTIEVHYGGHLLGYAETGMAYVRDRVDSAYTLLREDAYAYPVVGYPSVAVRQRAGLPTYRYSARITVPATHVVANGGNLAELRRDGATDTYGFESLKPSWRMDFAVAHFRTLRRGDLTVFHLPEDSAGALRVAEGMARALALYTRWFGPLQGRSPFTVIEIPDGWGSQADVTSLLQAAAAFRDSSRVRELYHELSHLWNAPSTERPSPRWNEGLASFLEDLATDSLSGRATSDSTAIRFARWLATRLPADSLLRTVPPAQYGARGMTDYAYSVGSLMFYALYHLAGHDAFCRMIGDYYRRYAAAGGTTADFVRVAEAASPASLTTFFEDWLYSARWSGVVADAKAPRDLWARYARRAVSAAAPPN